VLTNHLCSHVFIKFVPSILDLTIHNLLHLAHSTSDDPFYKGRGEVRGAKIQDEV
jgi:hypothetical protein